MKLRLSVMQIFICLALVALVGVVSIAFISATSIRDTMVEDRQDKVKQITLGVYSTIEKILERKNSNEITEKQATDLVFNTIQDFRYDGKNYVFAIRYDSCVFSHFVPKLIGDCKPGKLRDDLASVGKSGGGFYRYKTRKAGFEGEDFDKVSFVQPVNEMDMYIGSGVYFDDINQVYLKRLLELSVFGVIIVLVILGVGVYVGKAISGSIRTVSNSMDRLSKGDFEIELDFDSFIKEIGFIFQSLDVFRNELQKKKELENEKSGLTTKAEEDRKKAALELADQFDRTVGRIVQNVSTAASDMEHTATEMTQIAAKTTDRAVDVSTAAKEANENTSAVASATEQLSSSISEIGSQVQRASQVANQAVEESQSANERVSGLVAAADKVGEVVTLITDIANQTNLLALNATIEAARAGEMGKGFAVVASEVKNLASQTAQATEEIATQVATIQKETQASVSAIENIGSTINDINAISSTIAAAVEEQGVATDEISRNIRGVSSGTHSVTENITSVQSSSDESRSSAETVKEAANQLTVQSNLLSDEVDSFLKEIRAS